MSHRSLKKSNEYFKRALKSLPLGVSSNFRYWGEEKTLYIKKGKGARIWDIDDNEYIDYRLGYGPAILGYADDRVDAAAREGMEVGGVFALATELEAVVAERIQKMVPTAELVRFSISGTEAVIAALRLARGYTGKDSYIIVEGGYHGLHDATLWNAAVEKMSPGDLAPPLEPYCDGVPGLIKQMIHCVPLNDANFLEDVLKKNSDQIGAFLIEPIMGNCCGIPAQADYVKAARELCDRYGVVMIIDEVKTGFRVARGGVQELMNVQADISTFAKALANGYPISAVAGREEIMRKIGDGVAHGGTYTAHSVCIAAANKTLEILDETDALKTIETYGKNLQAGFSKILDARGIAHSFVGHASMGGLFFAEEAPTNYRDWVKHDATLYEALAGNLHDLGILPEDDSREPWFICEAHSDGCLDETVEKFEIALDTTLKELGRS
ncbi:MAG: aminotransferase class III-fold pyridoxal phosphate-dependent enzyme [Deltaproteobacteria bacterium]|nr:aminotransferase class III-fold pyridoxal phosphate-dependent enzyme [Deltaproteobacteria bacterium]